MKIFILFLLIVIPIQSIAETCEEDDVLSAKNCIPEDVDFKELEYVLTKRMRTKSICFNVKKFKSYIKKSKNVFSSKEL